MANQKISDRTLASSLTGTEKIPIGVTGNKATTPDQLKTYVDAPATLDDLTDVVITTPSDGQVLTYDSVSGDWVNETPTGGGVASVTGDGVDNTDPDNPVLSYPTPSDIGAWSLANGGTLTANNTLSGSFGVGLGVAPPANTKLIVRGFGTTTAKSFIVENSSGVEQLSINDRGEFNIRTDRLSIQHGGQTIIKSTAASGTNFALLIRLSNNNALFSVNHNGRFSIGSASNPTYFSATTAVGVDSNGGDGFKIAVAAGGAAVDKGHIFLTTRTTTNALGGNQNFVSIGLGAEWNVVTGSDVRLDQLVIQPTYNFNGTRNVTAVGFRYNPINTSMTAVTNIAYTHDSGFVQWSSVLSPAQITSNQNDYNPTGFNNGGAPNGASILRLDSDAARDITGLVGGVSGRLLIVANVGAFTITLKNEDAGSTAANRFLNTGSTDKILTTNTSTMLWYDGTSSRWRII